VSNLLLRNALIRSVRLYGRQTCLEQKRYAGTERNDDDATSCWYTMGSQPQQAGLVSCWHAGRSLLLTSKSYPRPKLRKARRFERRQARMAGVVDQAVLTIVSCSERLPFQKLHENTSDGAYCTRSFSHIRGGATITRRTRSASPSLGMNVGRRAIGG